MRALARFLVRDWPLKLGALGLAVVLYSGIVLSENTRTWPGRVPIEVVDPPAGGVLLDLPGSVEAIRYRAPVEVARELTSGSFRATLDLSGITPQAGGPPVEVPVRLVPLDQRVQVVDYAPRSLDVRLDRIGTRMMPVTVSRDAPPEGFALGPAQTEPGSVTLRGPTTRLAQARSAVARVAVDASGLNIDREVDVEVLDESGNVVPGVEAIPGRVRVRIDVARELAYGTVPVVVATTGQPSPGYRIARVGAEPPTVTVSGEASAVGRLASVSTEPVDVTDLAGDIELTAPVVPPPDITIIGAPEVRVRVDVEPVSGSRTVEAGLVIVGARPDRRITVTTPSVLVTLRGPVERLDALEAAATGLVARLDVSRLGTGRREVPVSVEPPEGVEVVAIAPERVVVRIAGGRATSAPIGSASPSPSASGPAPASPAAGDDDASVRPSPPPATAGASLASPAPSGGS